MWLPPVVEKITDAVWRPSYDIRSEIDTVDAEGIHPVLASRRFVARASMALSSGSRASEALPSTVLAASKAVP
jgi:hypothetical protein